MEGFHLNDKIYQQDIFSYCIQGRLKLLDAIVISHTIHPPSSQLAPQYLDVCPQVVTQVAPSKILIKNLMVSLAADPVFHTVLICVSLTNSNILQHSLILLYFHLPCSLFCLYFDTQYRKMGSSITWFSR